ncbi:putative inorganic phosphate transporter [Rhodococcus sp. AW25M09]|nr:putative inorganic phosphate transporter [Rhodococcus sp. AW25M09]
MICMMAIIAFVALLWGTVGYVYAEAHPLRRAAFVGGGVLISGWLIVLAAVSIKIARLKARRRESNSDTD